VQLIILKIVFWLSSAALVYTYVIYPLVLQILSLGKKLVLPCFSLYDEDELPTVFIQQKLQSVFLTNYPKNKIKVLVGSDGSTDNTDTIINSFAHKYAVNLYIFEGRSGKPYIINELYKKYLTQIKNKDTDILLLTDANVLFEPDTIFELVKYFKDEQTGIVGATINNTLKNTLKQEGIGFLEKQYISRENKIKQNESILFNKAMGVFGGCYALRAHLYKPIPAKFIVDDFFISLSILQKEYYIIQNIQALAYEDVPGSLTEELRRKRRIGAGNIQNLIYFKNQWFPPFNTTAWLYFSHKIVRWFGPFCILLCWLSSLILTGGSWLFQLFFGIQTILLLVALLNYILKDTFALPAWVKFIGYFYAMNLALLLGFFDYLKGIRTNVWEPTERNIGTS